VTVHDSAAPTHRWGRAWTLPSRSAANANSATASPSC